jgi:hypothetical protein
MGELNREGKFSVDRNEKASLFSNPRNDAYRNFDFE